MTPATLPERTLPFKVSLVLGGEDDLRLNQFLNARDMHDACERLDATTFTAFTATEPDNADLLDLLGLDGPATITWDDVSDLILNVQATLDLEDAEPLTLSAEQARALTSDGQFSKFGAAELTPEDAARPAVIADHGDGLYEVLSGHDQLHRAGRFGQTHPALVLKSAP